MQTVTTIGLDIAKSVFQVHGIDANGKVLLPGVGPALATALVASVPDPKAFRSVRNFSAWIGLVHEAALEWRQGQARQYQQARRSLSAQPIHRRRPRRDPLCQDAWHKASPLAYGTAGAAANQSRCHRARQ